MRELMPQDVANTVWANETMGRKPGDRLMGRAAGGAGGGDIRGVQSAGCCLLLYKAAFVEPPTEASASHQQVSDALRDMGLQVEDDQNFLGRRQSLVLRCGGPLISL